DEESQEALLDPHRLATTLARLPVSTARHLHAQSHTTMSCNVVQGGQKLNIIPYRVMLEVDIRTMPGVTRDDVDAPLHEILGDLADDVTIEPPLRDFVSSRSSMGTTMWDAIASRVREAFPGRDVSPGMVVGRTDATYFRARGVEAYGASLFSPAVDGRAMAA